MRVLARTVVAFSFGIGMVATTPRSAAAQTVRAPLDKWVTQPTTITLSKAQRLRIDSLKVRYTAERDSLVRVKGQGGEMGFVVKMRGLDAKYLESLRAILTPEQRTILDRNLQAGGPSTRPPRPEL
jgi:hypothetical protein